MLLQRVRREVRGCGASIERTVLVCPSFGVTVLRTDGLAQDWGAQLTVVSFLAQMRRAQLSVVLAGRGYFAMPAGPLLLGPGDVIESDQQLGQAEGYTGRPGLVLIVEWDRGELFGAGVTGAARHSRLGPADVARLRSHALQMGNAQALPWLLGLCELLRACGLNIEREVPPTEVRAPRAAALYDAMGNALERLEDFPSLHEVSAVVDVGERQCRRDLTQLLREIDQPYDGWRDFLSDARLGWVTQLLSIPALSQARVAELAGFRSPVALAHAFALRGAPTPGQLGAELRARWR